MLINMKKVVMNVKLSSQVNAGNVVYNNQLVYPEASVPFPVVVRGYRWTVKQVYFFYCGNAREVELSIIIPLLYINFQFKSLP
jgi:hypothetical protein